MERTHFESLYPAGSRAKEIAQIVSFIRQGTSCQLIGLPGTGRGNILGLLSYNRNVRKKHFGEYQTWIHFVYMNFSEVRAREAKDVIKYIFLSLADSLRDRGLDDAYTKVTELFRESLVLNDEFVLFQGLKNAVEYLAGEKKLTVVFLFDRFDEYLSGLTPEFFTNLRVLRDRARFRFSVVFSLSRPLEDIVEENLLYDYYDYVASHHVYVSLYDKESIMFKLQYLQKVTGRSLPEALITEIYRLTSMHERLLRMSFEAVFQNYSPYAMYTKTTKVSAADIAHLSTYLLQQKTIQKALAQIEQVLTPHEQKMLRSKDFTKHVVGESLVYLENIGLVEHGEITIPLFAQYFVTKGAREAKNTSFSYDVATNTIRRGEDVLSESLTAAEFRLLSHLIKHADQVIDREEIIHTVWEENKSTMGVTDQALDQLVFRLRKKIEEDPNDPQHLVTVKGRGFKFIL